jgi:hypothetical protein
MGDMDKEVEAEVKEEVCNPSHYNNLNQLSLDDLSKSIYQPRNCTLPARLGCKVSKKTSANSMFCSASPGSVD